MANYTKYSMIQKRNNPIIPTEWALLEGVFITPQNDYIARITNSKGRKETVGRYQTKKEATQIYKVKTKEVLKELNKRRKEREKLSIRNKENNYVGFLM